jgi:ubiquinone/menaquinone biosynthesis C-methylase UbiE
MGDELFEEWQVYEKLLIHDYMDHHAFFARLQAEILARFERPIALLDLGCGDLTPILPMLAGLPLLSYVGIDESEQALARASRRLEESRIPGRVVRADLLAALGAMEERFDVILASFSLHHLPDPGSKLRTLEAGRKRLAADGLFALIDVFSAEAETREQYLERWIAHAEARYLALQRGEKELLFRHVRSRDFPVSIATFQGFGKQAGLENFSVLLQDRERLNGLVTFSA